MDRMRRQFSQRAQVHGGLSVRLSCRILPAMKSIRLLFSALFLITACDRGGAPPSAENPKSKTENRTTDPGVPADPSKTAPPSSTVDPPSPGAEAPALRGTGLQPDSRNQKPETGNPSPDDFVELVALDPTFVIDVRYATENNFMKKRVYPVAKAYLRREAAEALVRVQARLKPQGLGLKIYDGYRPLSVQWILWKILPDDRYVANPKKGSKHNRGAAVDLTLVDRNSGAEMEMPTEYDNFTERAWMDDPNCTSAAARNRKTLQTAMIAEGFETIDHEWWHFDYKTWKRYDISDHPIR